MAGSSSKRRRGGSLADEIAGLLDTRPAGPVADEDEGGEELGLLAPEDAPAPMPARKLRAVGIDLGESGAKYAGRVVSRQRLEGRGGLRRHAAELDDDDDDDDDGDDDHDSTP